MSEIDSVAESRDCFMIAAINVTAGWIDFKITGEVDFFIAMLLFAPLCITFGVIWWLTG